MPSLNPLLLRGLEVETGPSKNYKMEFQREVINGYTDQKEAMQQVIYKILNTERYQYIIYSWNYGIELAALFGEPLTYVCPELERRIKEALVQDDRVNAVDQFCFETDKKGQVKAVFTVHTVFGNLQEEKVVNF